MSFPDDDFDAFMDAQDPDNHLRTAFDKMCEDTGAIPPGMRKALLEAFMAGAAAHDRIMTEAIEKEDPEHVAHVLDSMATEIRNRHKDPGT